MAFYSYSALGTDRYPPFTLERTDYPADLEVEYPGHLSRGLVLVKWWLLAIPHYLVLAVLAGGWLGGWGVDVASGDRFGNGVASHQLWAPGSLLGVLVLITGVSLLYTCRYQRPLFDFIWASTVGRTAGGRTPR